MNRLILAITEPKTLLQMSNDYEKELYTCVKSWRTNAGYLKDIPISLYATYNIGNVLDEFNVEIVYGDNTNIDKFAYAIVHKAGLMFQSKYPNDTLIHIDIDMYINKPLDPKVFLFKDALIGKYPDFSDCYERLKLQKEYNIIESVNTDFIITKPHSTFYSNYLKYYDILSKKHNTDFWAFEEFVADYIVQKFDYDLVYNYEDVFTII